MNAHLVDTGNRLESAIARLSSQTLETKSK